MTGLTTGDKFAKSTDKPNTCEPKACEPNTCARAGMILVGPVHTVSSAATADASHIVTLINAQLMPTIPTPPRLPPERHLRLVMSDVEKPTPGRILPDAQHIADLIAFVSAWDQRAPLLIHCLQGVSRSTAAMYISLCALNPDVAELTIAQRLREVSASAAPNRLLIRLGDDLLKRSGRMSAAIAAIGEGNRAVEGELFCLPARLAPPPR